MGAWGHGIRQDDFVLDVIGVFEDALKAGRSVADATNAVKAKYGGAIEDDEDGPLFWIAVADVQWSHGELHPEVLQQVQRDVAAGRGLDRWRDDPGALVRRTTALQEFVARIASPNPRPKKSRMVVRAPKFTPGDCLSVQLSSGEYAAALVLAADHSHPEQGRNLVGLLDYVSKEKPTVDVFRRRRWLVVGSDGGVAIAWYYPIGFRTVKNRIETVANIALLDSDPRDSNSYRRWTGIGEAALQQRQ